MELLPSHIFDDFSMVFFENIVVPIPKRYDEYLTCLFGDYMQLPPLAQRQFTHEGLDAAPWRLGPTND